MFVFIIDSICVNVYLIHHRVLCRIVYSYVNGSFISSLYDIIEIHIVLYSCIFIIIPKRKTMESSSVYICQDMHMH